MLGKNWILTTFCVFLLFSRVEAAWEKVQVQGLINSDRYALTDGREVALFGVKGLDLEFPDKSEVCLTEEVKLQLSQIFSQHSSKLKMVNEAKGYVKFGTNDLAQFMVAQGWAVAQDDKYFEAQSEAQKNHRGRWGRCDPNLNMIKWQKARGRTPWFWDRYHTYLSSSSVGKVVSVESGNVFVLENGLRVQLKDVIVPRLDDERIQHRCFAERSRDYLSSLMLGRRVSIRHDYGLLPGYKTISRQVYLPQTRHKNAVWLNEKMIQAGYGRLSADSESESLIATQEAIWEDPVGAWEICLGG